MQLTFKAALQPDKVLRCSCIKWLARTRSCTAARRWFMISGTKMLDDVFAMLSMCSLDLREKLKVPPRPFPLEELSHYNHSGQLQVFFTQLEPNVHGVRQSSHISVETNSNKRISVLGTNHTKIYRVNLVGFKHKAEDPARSPHKQNKYTLRSKRFSNVLTNHQGRFPKPWDRQDSQLNLATVPEAKPLTNRGTFHKRLTLMILHPPHFAEGFLKDLRRDQQKTNSGPSALGGCPGHIPLVRTRHSSTRPPNTTQRRSLIKRACRF